jgi:hypothetical protein
MIVYEEPDNKPDLTRESGRDSTSNIAGILLGSACIVVCQTAAAYLNGFSKLYTSTKIVHFASMSLIAMAGILLTFSFFRSVAHGEEPVNPRLNSAKRMFLTAIVLFSCGVSEQMYVVALIITGSFVASIALAGMILSLSCEVCFATPIRLRHRRRSDRRGQTR